MNADATDIVKALLELSKTKSNGQQLLRDVHAQLGKQVHGEGDLSVTLITPSGSEPHLASAVSALLHKKFGREVSLTERKNADLIGGAVVQIGDEQIDLSVRGALNELESQLRSTPIS